MDAIFYNDFFLFADFAIFVTTEDVFIQKKYPFFTTTNSIASNNNQNSTKNNSLHKVYNWGPTGPFSMPFNVNYLTHLYHFSNTTN